MVMAGKNKEEDLIPIINKASLYEDFLKDMYQIISKYVPIEEISWIVKKES
jgi:hypothetical protein